MTASTESAPVRAPGAPSSLFTLLLRLGDDNLVLAQRISEWVSRAPELEEDIAIANLALDHLGVARALLARAAEVEGAGRTEDDLAFLRTEREFLNVLLVEQPNGDFAETMARQLFVDAFQLSLWDRLASAADEPLAGIAAKALKEASYHLRHSSTWVVRLGDGTEESHRRMQAGIDHLWRFTGELFEFDGIDASAGVALDGIDSEWDRRIDGVLAAATLRRPDTPMHRGGGRSGFHTEHLGHLLAEMQWMQRTYPGLEW